MGGTSHVTDKKSAAHKPALEHAKIFDYMLEGCQIISPDYRYLYVNDVVARQGHSTREKLLGRTMMECYPGIEKSEMFDHLRACMEKREVHRIENEFPFPDGTIGWFELRMEPLDEGVIILSLDITERKKAEERVRQLEEIKTTFVKIVSGQLRLPVATIRDSLETLRAIPADTFGLPERVQLLAAHNASMEIMDRIGEMTQAVDTGNDRAHLQKKLTPFGDIWASIYAECKLRSEAERVHLVYVEPSPPLPSVQCDVDRMKLVLVSLVDNALRYTPTGKITIILDHQQGFIRFQVSDTGVGLPASEQPQVFHKHFRGSNARQINPGGTGLSLAIAKYYVEQHGGTIGFTSEQDKGSTFWFEVPVH